MNRTVLARLIALLIAIAAVVVVGVVAYHVGVTNSTVGPAIRVMPYRGNMMGWGDGSGAGLVWLVGLVVIGLLFVWLLAAILAPDRGGSNRAGLAGSASSTAGDVEKLHDLSEMHAQGRLTDEEFTAAKRKLLGLQ
jgi:uncharacterized membrane protein